MMATLNASNLSLETVHHLFGFQEQYDGAFEPLLTLEPLTDVEQQDLQQIRHYFLSYLREGKVSEGMVKALTLFPLLRLTGFYRAPIRLTVEENIETITIVDQQTQVSGRLDLLAVNKDQQTQNGTALWVLVVEAKNSEVDALAGLPQLLTYAHQSLQEQDAVWGLTTNGLTYWFVHIQQGHPPRYQYMPVLSLLQTADVIQLAQVLKAIAQHHPAVSPMAATV